MQDQFKTRLEVINWLNDLSEADAVYLGNLDWVLYHNPLGDEAKKIENIRAELKEQLKQVLEIENTPFFKKLLLKLKSFVVFSVFGTLNFAYPAALVISITLDRFIR